MHPVLRLQEAEVDSDTSNDENVKLLAKQMPWITYILKWWTTYVYNDRLLFKTCHSLTNYPGWFSRRHIIAVAPPRCLATWLRIRGPNWRGSPIKVLWPVGFNFSKTGIGSISWSRAASAMITKVFSRLILVVCSLPNADDVPDKIHAVERPSP